MQQTGKILSTIVITAVVVGGVFYFWQQKNIVSNQVQDMEQPKTNKQTQSIKSNNDWNTYQNNNLDITFQYPLSWQPINDYTSWSNDFFKLEFKPTELKRDSDGHLHIVGINHKTYVNEGPPGWYGYCAVQYKNIEDFCKEGCEKISKNVAIDYRRVYHGEGGFSAIAYSDLSAKYPSICFELDLIQIFEELKDPTGTNTTADIKALIKNKQASAPILQAVENFESFARSIKQK